MKITGTVDGRQPNIQNNREYRTDMFSIYKTQISEAIQGVNLDDNLLNALMTWPIWESDWTGNPIENELLFHVTQF